MCQLPSPRPSSTSWGPNRLKLHPIVTPLITGATRTAKTCSAQGRVQLCAGQSAQGRVRRADCAGQTAQGRLQLCPGVACPSLPPLPQKTLIRWDTTAKPSRQTLRSTDMQLVLLGGVKHEQRCHKCCGDVLLRMKGDGMCRQG